MCGHLNDLLAEVNEHRKGKREHDKREHERLDLPKLNDFGSVFIQVHVAELVAHSSPIRRVEERGVGFPLLKRRRVSVLAHARKDEVDGCNVG